MTQNLALHVLSPALIQSVQLNGLIDDSIYDDAVGNKSGARLMRQGRLIRVGQELANQRRN